MSDEENLKSNRGERLRARVLKTLAAGATLVAVAAVSLPEVAQASPVSEPGSVQVTVASAEGHGAALTLLTGAKADGHASQKQWFQNGWVRPWQNWNNWRNWANGGGWGGGGGGGGWGGGWGRGRRW